MIRPLLLVLLAAGWAASPAAAQDVVRQAAIAHLPQDLSLWGMVAHADWVVKAVLAGLAFASVLTWTTALAKAVEVLAARRRVSAGLRILGEAGSLDEARARMGGEGGACAALVRAAIREAAAPQAGGAKERAAWRLERIAAGAARTLTRGSGVLATIGATAPFVGLFGTVWGIMESFIGISRAQTTNLAVVAPGIAEALLTTAIGLVAAIPAVVIYNLFARAAAAQRALLADAVAETMAMLSRDLEGGPGAPMLAAGG